MAFSCRSKCTKFFQEKKGGTLRNTDIRYNKLFKKRSNLTPSVNSYDYRLIYKNNICLYCIIYNSDKKKKIASNRSGQMTRFERCLSKRRDKLVGMHKSKVELHKKHLKHLYVYEEIRRSQSPIHTLRNENGSVSYTITFFFCLQYFVSCVCASKR